MHCPHNILLCNNWIYLGLHTRGDKSWDRVTWSEKLNPLRWQINLWREPPIARHYGRYWLIRVNQDAHLNRKWSNFKWRYLGGEARYKRRAAKRKSLQYDR